MSESADCQCSCMEASSPDSGTSTLIATKFSSAFGGPGLDCHSSLPEEQAFDVTVPRSAPLLSCRPGPVSLNNGRKPCFFASFTGAREEGPYQSAPSASTKIKPESPKNGSALKFLISIFARNIACMCIARGHDPNSLLERAVRIEDSLVEKVRATLLHS